MNILILGCGTIGVMTGNLLADGGHRVRGLRRHPEADAGQRFPILTGDLAEAGDWLPAMAAEPIDAVLLAANPGLRRGRDNRLVAGARLVVEHLPRARFVCTGTTSVYGDAAGGGVNEDTAIARSDPAIAALMAIEDAVAAHPRHLILRVAALIGPTRTHASQRMRAAAADGRPCVIAGDAQRPFNYLHEADCAELCAEALLGGLGKGLLNAVAPHPISVRDYYTALAHGAGIAVDVVGDGTAAPSRRVDGRRLQAMRPGRTWRGIA